MWWVDEYRCVSILVFETVMANETVFTAGSPLLFAFIFFCAHEKNSQGKVGGERATEPQGNHHITENKQEHQHSKRDKNKNDKKSMNHNKSKSKKKEEMVRACRERGK